jgi:hypothetical protein
MEMAKTTIILEFPKTSSFHAGMLGLAKPPVYGVEKSPFLWSHTFSLQYPLIYEIAGIARVAGMLSK